MANDAEVEGVDGSLSIFNLNLARLKWKEFVDHLEELKQPWHGSAARWASSVPVMLREALNGKLVTGPEGLPLYFDASPSQFISYRPSIAVREDKGDVTYFVISFNHLPKELIATAPGKSGVIFHYLDLCRMMRWGVLEDPDIIKFFKNPLAASERTRKDVAHKFLTKIMNIRAEFWNRGFRRDELKLLTDDQRLQRIDDMTKRYAAIMIKIDPEDRGVLPDVIPSIDVMVQIHGELLAINKEYFLFLQQELKDCLEGLKVAIDEI
jgi:hypothetical protein